MKKRESAQLVPKSKLMIDKIKISITVSFLIKVGRMLHLSQDTNPAATDRARFTVGDRIPSKNKSDPLPLLAL